MRAAAEQHADKIDAVVRLIAAQFETCAKLGIDPNEIRDEVRAKLVANGLPPIKATNMVRLAIYLANYRNGAETYSKDDLRQICAHVAGNR